MPTTITTEHANELILVDEALDPAGRATVSLGLSNRDGSDTFPGRTLTPDQAEELAASLALSAAAARARAGLAPTPRADEHTQHETLAAIQAAVPLTSSDGHDQQADSAGSQQPAQAQALATSPPRPTAKPRTTGKPASFKAPARRAARAPTKQTAATAEPRGPGAKALPIAEYDQLNVAEITKRLPGLSRAQLSKLLAYEQTHRNRKTICDRIASLRA